MTKTKKRYCMASFLFACAVVICTISLMFCRPAHVKAASMEPDSITSMDGGGDGTVADINSGNTNGLSISYNNDDGSVSTPIKMLLVLTVLSLAPSILIMLTSFTRIIVVLHFVRTAIGTQTAPPNQVLIGLALFLTFFIMSPVIDKIYVDAYQPFSEEKISMQEALEKGAQPLREFMLRQTREADLGLFARLANTGPLQGPEAVPMRILLPAYVTSELKTAFQIGFTIFIPFLIIDLVIASVLMSLGMMMVPPATIALPFKLMLFVLVDGWQLLVGSLAQSFYS